MFLGGRGLLLDKKVEMFLEKVNSRDSISMDYIETFYNGDLRTFK